MSITRTVEFVVCSIRCAVGYAKGIAIRCLGGGRSSVALTPELDTRQGRWINCQ